MALCFNCEAYINLIYLGDSAEKPFLCTNCIQPEYLKMSCHPNLSNLTQEKPGKTSTFIKNRIKKFKKFNFKKNQKIKPSQNSKKKRKQKKSNQKTTTFTPKLRPHYRYRMAAFSSITGKRPKNLILTNKYKAAAHSYLNNLVTWSDLNGIDKQDADLKTVRNNYYQ